MSTQKPILAIRLRQLREEKRLSQIDLSKEIHISNTTLSDYERGKSAPDYDKLRILSKYYDVTVDYLLGLTDVRNEEKEYTTPDEFQFALYEQSKDLDEDQKRTILEIIKVIKKSKG